MEQYKSADDLHRVQFAEGFGKRLREVRENMVLSQTAFGLLGGVARVAQANYEKGIRLPAADYLYALMCEGVDVGYLLSGKRQPEPQAGAMIDPVLLEKCIDVAQQSDEKAVGGISRSEVANVAAFVYGMFAAMTEPFDDDLIREWGGKVGAQWLRRLRSKHGGNDVH